MMMTYFLPEKKPAGDVNPAMFSLQILALSTATAAGSTNDPDHGLETILDGGEVHADPLYPGHGGDQLSPQEKGKPDRILPGWPGQVRPETTSLLIISIIETQTLVDLTLCFYYCSSKIYFGISSNKTCLCFPGFTIFCLSILLHNCQPADIKALSRHSYQTFISRSEE